MSIKITQLPPVPAGTITGQTALPISKTSNDPKTYKMTLGQMLTWFNNNGIGGAQGPQGYQGVVGPEGGIGPQGPKGAQGLSGAPGVPGSSGYQGFTGPQGFSGFSGFSGNSGFSGHSGFSGVSGHSGYQGSMGSSTGQPGPGLVYTGNYRNTSYTYYNSLRRKDVVSYGGTYYLANSNTLSGDSGATGWQAPGVVSGEWSNFGNDFKSVATGLLLTEDASVTKTITLGEVDNLSAGIIRSANCDNFFDGKGFWLGNDSFGNVGFFVGNSDGPSYLLYDSTDGVVELSGTIYATAGSIGGVGVAEGIIYTGSPVGAGTSATPFYLNGSTSYAPGEILFSLGNRLLFAVDPYNPSLTVISISGSITANAGSIGGLGIAEYNNGVSNGTVIYSGLYNTPGFNTTPIFINGRKAGTYANGEVIFGLGSGFVYYYDSGANTYIAQISGTIRANAGSIGGIGITQGYLYSGAGTPGNANTPFYLSPGGDFTLGTQFIYNHLTKSLEVSGTIYADAGRIGGVSLAGGVVYINPTGATYQWNNPDVKFFADKNGYFSLGNKLTFNPSTNLLTVNGDLSALGGTIGGWRVGTNTLSSLNSDVFLHSGESGGVAPYLGIGTKSYNTEGIWLGKSGSAYKFYAGDGANNYVKWDGAGLTVKGCEAVDGIYISSVYGIRAASSYVGTITITGGTDNGINYGSQIDLTPNSNRPGASGSTGALQLQAAGAGTSPHIIMRTGDTGSNTGYVRFQVYDNGLVRVIDAGSGAQSGNFDVQGDITASGDVQATSFTTTSTRLLKENIQPYEKDVISKLKLLKPVTFTWNKKSKVAGREDFGLIAEEVQEVFPELVTKVGSKLSVDYSKLSVILLKVIQEKLIN